MSGEKTKVKVQRRAFFFMAQGGVCCLRRTVDCQIVEGRMDITERRTPRRATWDHITPKCDGGPFARNVLLACLECNNDRKNEQPPFGLGQRAAELWEAWLVVAPPPPPPPVKKEKKKAGRPSDDALVEQTLALEDEQARRERKMARAKALGVTDPQFLPGAKGAA